MDSQDPYICDVCGVRLNKYRTLHVHKQVHERYSKQYSLQCAAIYGSETSAHKNNKPYLSPKKPKEKKRMKRKEKKQDNKADLPAVPNKSLGVKSHTCNMCGKNFLNLSNLSKHKIIHSLNKKIATENESEYNISEDRMFAYGSVKTESLAPAPGDWIINDLLEDDKPNMVEITSSIIENNELNEINLKKKGLNNEIKSELSVEKANKGASFPQLGQRKKSSIIAGMTSDRHGRRKWHNDVDKPHGCRECNKRFNRSDQLMKHMRTHTGAKPFECELCGKCYRQKFHLRNHLKTFDHSEKPEKPVHICQYCGKIYKKNSELVYHVRTHTGEKPFACDVCERLFARKNQLNTHMKKHGRM